jgi:hypothetical protein
MLCVSVFQDMLKRPWTEAVAETHLFEASGTMTRVSSERTGVEK